MERSEKYINEVQVFEMTDIAVQTLRNHRFQGRGIPYYKIGRSIRYRLDDVIAFMEGHKIQTRNSLTNKS